MHLLLRLGQKPVHFLVRMDICGSIRALGRQAASGFPALLFLVAFGSSVHSHYNLSRRAPGDSSCHPTAGKLQLRDLVTELRKPA